MNRRPLIALTVTAGLLVSASAPPPPVQSRSRFMPPPGDSPVRCRAVEGVRPGPSYRPSTTRGFRLSRQTPSVAIPAPPPMVAPAPMAPPSIVAQSNAGNVTVTGNRVAGRSFNFARAPYGSRENTERYDGRPVATIQDVAAAPVSTFSVDVDTGAYANVRRFLNQGQAVPAEAVRTEELINYFRYDYPRPTNRSEPFSVTTDVARSPWNPATRLLRIGLRAYDVPSATRPPANLVFLVDTSGSMMEEDKLPLVKRALEGLADQLRPDDRVSIVAYAGSAGLVLAPTNNKNYIKAALSCLEAGGSTGGGAAIELAYATARANMRPGGINRIFLATDGDFNVGISDRSALEAMVKRNRDDGITLTALGFGQGNYNDAMMERIADVGNGNYGYIDSASEARKVLEDELSATLVTVAKDVKVQVEFNPAQVSQYRLIGYENRALREEDFTNDAVDAGDMGAGPSGHRAVRGRPHRQPWLDARPPLRSEPHTRSDPHRRRAGLRQAPLQASQRQRLARADPRGARRLARERPGTDRRHGLCHRRRGVRSAAPRRYLSRPIRLCRHPRARRRTARLLAPAVRRADAAGRSWRRSQWR